MPVMSAGIRSGVNWIRLNAAVDDVGDRADEHRLAEAGHALEQDVAVGQEPGQGLADERGLADDDAPDLAFDGLGAFGEGLGREAGRGLIGARSTRVMAASGGQFEGSSELK